MRREVGVEEEEGGSNEAPGKRWLGQCIHRKGRVGIEGSGSGSGLYMT